VFDPGLSRHEWESEMASLDEELHDSPAETLPALDELLGRMLAETGYDITDAVAREGDEREVVAEYQAAHEITTALDGGSDDISSGDVAAAINGYRALFDYLVSSRSAAGGTIEEP
jgi:hypothetical protein